MIKQKTRYDKFLIESYENLFGNFKGSWRRRSLGLISLLTGFYIGSNITAYLLARSGQRIFIAILMVALVECVVRIRTRVNNTPWPLYLVCIDNLRVGTVYAVVLEAFKLGS